MIKILVFEGTDGFGSSWEIPSDWTDVNKIEVIGAGDRGSGIDGGGGGAYASVDNVTGLTPGQSLWVKGGQQGGEYDYKDSYVSTNTEDPSYMGDGTIVAALGGEGRYGGGNHTGDMLGDTIYNGGNAGMGGGGGSGGGGSAGQHGAGGNGENADNPNGGAGGTADGGGTAGGAAGTSGGDGGSPEANSTWTTESGVYGAAGGAGGGSISGVGGSYSGDTNAFGWGGGGGASDTYESGRGIVVISYEASEVVSYPPVVRTAQGLNRPLRSTEQLNVEGTITAGTVAATSATVDSLQVDAITGDGFVNKLNEFIDAPTRAALAGTEGTPSTDNKFVTSDDPRLVRAGKAVSRIVVGTIAEDSITKGQFCYIGGDGTVHPAIATGPGYLTGIALADAFSGTVELLVYGSTEDLIMDWTSGADSEFLTPLALYYLSTTNSGTITTTRPTGDDELAIYVGRALTTTELLLHISEPVPTKISPSSIDASDADDDDVLTSSGGVAAFAPPTGGGGGGDGSVTKNVINGSGGTIYQGQAVRITAADEVDKANSSDISTAKVVGLVKSSSILDTAEGDIICSGILHCDDWSVTTFSADLIPGSTYYLSTGSGYLSPTPADDSYPTAEIGIALNTKDLLIRIQAVIG